MNGLEYINKIFGCFDSHRGGSLEDGARSCFNLKLEVVMFLEVSKIFKNGFKLPAALCLSLPNPLPLTIHHKAATILVVTAPNFRFRKSKTHLNVLIDGLIVAYA